ncbi:MAG: tetratricopeptide repeat protein [Deltaproteobacteria bacterium]|nr:tetratricopeptide repeat protein [Deltaproteobacteria bacterium]
MDEMIRYDCSSLEEYLDRSLDPTGSRAFEEHIASCESCRKAVAEWMQIEARLREWNDLHKPVDSASKETDALLARAGHGRPFKVERDFSWMAYMGIAAVPAIAVVLFLILFRGSVENPPARDIARSRQKSSIEKGTPNRVARRLSAPGDRKLLVSLGPDHIGLSAGTDVDILQTGPDETRLRLRLGTIAAKVRHRKTGKAFIVMAGRYKVRVTGTCFFVKKKGLGIEVGVMQGRVLVTGPPREAHMVDEGWILDLHEGDFNFREMEHRESVENFALLEPVKGKGEEHVTHRGRGKITTGRHNMRRKAFTSTPQKIGAGTKDGGPIPTVEKWKKLALSGRVQDALAGLEALVRKHSNNVAVWLLLADCRRKVKDWSGAVDAYKKVIILSKGDIANRARLKAASVLQDHLASPGRAANLLSRYLELAPLRSPTRAEALLRFARCLLELGRTGRARKVLLEIVSNHKGTQAATGARLLLEKLESDTESSNHEGAPGGIK